MTSAPLVFISVPNAADMPESAVLTHMSLTVTAAPSA